MLFGIRQQPAHRGDPHPARAAPAQRHPGDEGDDLQQHAVHQQGQADADAQHAGQDRRPFVEVQRRRAGQQCRRRDCQAAGAPEPKQRQIAPVGCMPLQPEHGAGEGQHRPGQGRRRQPRRCPGQACNAGRRQQRRTGGQPQLQRAWRHRRRALKHRYGGGTDSAEQEQHPAADAEAGMAIGQPVQRQHDVPAEHGRGQHPQQHGAGEHRQGQADAGPQQALAAGAQQHRHGRHGDSQQRRRQQHRSRRQQSGQAVQAGHQQHQAGVEAGMQPRCQVGAGYRRGRRHRQELQQAAQHRVAQHAQGEHVHQRRRRRCPATVKHQRIQQQHHPGQHTPQRRGEQEAQRPRGGRRPGQRQGAHAAGWAPSRASTSSRRQMVMWALPPSSAWIRQA